MRPAAGRDLNLGDPVADADLFDIAGAMAETADRRHHHPAAAAGHRRAVPDRGAGGSWPASPASWCRAGSANMSRAARPGISAIWAGIWAGICAGPSTSGRIGAPLLPGTACIRATALGASEYSVQLSGQTSTITAPGRLLPRRSMQVIKPEIEFRLPSRRRRHRRGDPRPLRRLRPRSRHRRGGAGVFLGAAARLRQHPRAGRRHRAGNAPPAGPRRTAACHAGRRHRPDPRRHPARRHLDFANELLILDGLSLADFDYIDLGKIRVPSLTVPVTVKSLLFRDDARSGERVQFRAAPPVGPQLIGRTPPADPQVRVHAGLHARMHAGLHVHPHVHPHGQTTGPDHVHPPGEAGDD